MTQRPIRTRKKAKMLTPAIVDPLEFKKNKCSDYANHITTIVENINIQVWYDKHYHLREQIGDENGKRGGIDRRLIQPLVVASIKHLMFYSAVLPSFRYLNYHHDKTGRALRVVCQNNNLPVIIEAHVISIKEYEVTVITAMDKEDFKLSDGQYSVELLDNDLSILKLKSRGKIAEVCSV